MTGIEQNIGNVPRNLREIGCLIFKLFSSDVEKLEKSLRYDLSIEECCKVVPFDPNSIEVLRKSIKDGPGSSVVKSILRTLQNEFSFFNIRGDIKFGTCSLLKFKKFKIKLKLFRSNWSYIRK